MLSPRPIRAGVQLNLVEPTMTVKNVKGVYHHRVGVWWGE